MADGHQSPVVLEHEQLVDRWPDDVVVFDQHDRRCIHAHSAAEHLVGHCRDEMLAIRPGDLAHPDDAREIPTLLKQASAWGQCSGPGARSVRTGNSSARK